MQQEATQQAKLQNILEKNTRTNSKMNNRNSSILALIFIIFLIFITYQAQHKDEYIPPNLPDSIKIANWNMQIFGESKANDVNLMKDYIRKIKDYDIIFLQEIKDASGTAYKTLCNSLMDYNCAISSRAGTTSSKEQYLIVYKKNIALSQIIDYNLFNYTNQFERPPIEVVFTINYSKYINATSTNSYYYNITIWNIHTKPENVKEELINLEKLIPYQPGTMIIGDLNADCDYYNPEKEFIFKGWDWLIKDIDDTTVGASNCAYDRILVDNELSIIIKNTGIDKDVTKEQSDHYIIWTSFNRDYSINNIN